MKRWFFLWVSFCLSSTLALGVTAPAATANQNAPQTSSIWPHEQSDLEVDSNVVWGTLNNGLRYALLPNHEPPNRVSLRLVIEAGSLMETEDQRGLAHFLEHMAFRGSKNIPEDELVRYLERLGMAFGPDSNAFTGFEMTGYMLDLPDNDLALIDKGLSVFREFSDNLLFDKELIEKERGVILSERRLRDTPSFRSFVSEFEFVLPHSFLPRRLPIGEKAVIEKVPRKEFLSFYETHYIPKRTIVIAVGDFEPNALATLIKKRFGSYLQTQDSFPDPDHGVILPRKVEARFHSDPDLPTTVTLETVTRVPITPDTRAKRLAQLNQSLANGIISRRLSIRAKRPNAGFTSGQAQSNDFVQFARVTDITINAKSHQWEQALTVAEEELRRALKHGFEKSELAERKAAILNSAKKAAKSARTRKSKDLADQLVHHIGNKSVFTHPQKDLKETKQALKTVTVETVHQAFRDLWKDAEPLIFVAGDIALEDPEATIINIYRQSMARPVEPPKHSIAKPWPYKSFGKRSNIAERREVKDLAITQLTFTNNLRVNLKPTDFESDTVMVGVRFGSGLLEYPVDKPGLNLLANYFISGGLESHSHEELVNLFAGKTLSMRFGIDEDAFFLRGNTTARDLRLQLEVLAAYLVAPGYRPELLQQYQQSLDSLYKSLDHTAQGIYSKHVRRFLHGNDPRFGIPDKEIASLRTMEELQSWLEQGLSQSYLEITIVGDFEVAKAIRSVRKTFGSLPTRSVERPEYADLKRIDFPEDRSRKLFRYPTSDPKAIASVYWPSTGLQNPKEVRQLYLLANIFGDRLREKIRNEEGETYSPQCTNSSSAAFLNYGIFSAQFDANPKKAASLTDAILAIADDIVLKGVTQDELDRARNPWVTRIKELLRRNDQWLTGYLIDSQEKPWRLDMARTFLSDIESASMEELNDVARKYLNTQQALPIVILPEKRDSFSE